MSEQKPLTKADLARHWGVSRAYLTRLGKSESEGGKNMPEFLSLPEADAWRSVNAPPRPGNAMRSVPTFAGEQSSPKNSAEASEKIARHPRTTTPASNTGTPRAPDANAQLEPAPIDVRAFVKDGADIDELMLEQSTEIPQIAYGLFKLASATGNPNAISGALANWNSAANTSANVRTRYLEVQEKTRALIPLDEVMDVVGTELQAVRSALERLGDRCAVDANPADPALAQRVINAAVDAVLARFELLRARTQRELAAPAA